MKALSIAQPWAGMIMDGVKDIETRSWGPKNNRLPMRIAIVSTKQPSEIKPLIGPWDYVAYRVPGLMTRGAILGTVLLVEVKTYYDIETWHADHERHRVPDTFYKPGIRGWILESPHKLDIPKPYRGRLSLYEIPDKELD